MPILTDGDSPVFCQKTTDLICHFTSRDDLHGALTMLEEHIRFYIQTLPGIIILWAILWEKGSSITDLLSTALQHRGTNGFIPHDVS